MLSDFLLCLCCEIKESLPVRMVIVINHFQLVGFHHKFIFWNCKSVHLSNAFES